MRNQIAVDVQALRRNVAVVRGKLQAGVRLCAVVKADAYGHGAPEVATQIEREVDAFAVALTEEGVALRIAGIQKPILVLLPVEKQEISRALWYGLTLTVDSRRQLRAIERAAASAKTVAAVHFAVDTGMNRIGFTRNDRFAACCRQAANSPFLCLAGVFTHFSGGGEAVRRRQFALFSRRVALARKYAPYLTAHAAATSALSDPRYQLDMVRAGLCLYGYGTDGVQPVMTKTAPVIARRTVKPGDRLLYGEAPCERTHVKIIREGYADGLPRNGSGLFCAPMAMDTAAVVGNDGLPVQLIGKDSRADDVAERAGTISYEILAKAAMRAERKYVGR